MWRIPTPAPPCITARWATTTDMTTTPSGDGERRVIVLPVDPGLVCLRGLSPRRLRFEVEYGLERGTTANSFLFAAGPDAQGRPMPPVLVHPPGA